jgi:hypothetical protein
MNKILLWFVAKTELFSCNDVSVKEIADKMTPVREETLRLPRSFAHNLRIIIDSEYELEESLKVTETNSP